MKAKPGMSMYQFMRWVSDSDERGAQLERAYRLRDAERAEAKLAQLEQKTEMAHEGSTLYMTYIIAKLAAGKGLEKHEADFLKEYEKAAHPQMRPQAKASGVTIEPQNANILIQAQKAIGDGS